MRFVVVAVALTACNTAWKADGFVETSSGSPIEGASVAVVCDSLTLDKTVTTETGRFDVSGSSGASRALGCSLEVRKPGYHMRTLHMTEVCFRSAKTGNYDEPCSAKDGHVALTRDIR